MNNVTFRRAKNSPVKFYNIHPEFIVEYFDSDRLPKDLLTFKEGYEILGEEQFLLELEKNHTLYEEMKLQDETMPKALELSRAAELTRHKANVKINEREQQEFERWKQTRMKKRQ